MQNVIQTSRLYDSLILVVDDVETNRRILAHGLLAHGYTNIAIAADGAEALQITYARKPALVLLDLMMPGMDGFAYCQAIRRDKAYDNMPIIVQTALDDLEQKLRAFQLGANDYICKPVEHAELCARTQVHLNQKLMMEDLRSYRTNITAQLESARHMQDRLMPGEHQIQLCERVFDMKVAHHFETSSELGGDCWGMRPLSDYRLAIYMFDFSGHGMTSAMNVFRMHTIMHEFIHAGGEPGHFLSTLNRHLYPLLSRDDFATMFYGIIDIDANCLLYASAAVPPAILFPHTQTPMVLDGRGFPLGVVANATYETKYSPFNPGDLLLLFSDCLIETKNQAGEFLNDRQLIDTVQESLKSEPGNPADAAVKALLARLKTHNPAPVFDDNTINAYWRRPA